MTFGMGTGLRGINAARYAMQVIGQNVANVNTPGYTRQRVLLGSSFPSSAGSGFFIGTGVDVDGIQRVLDERLDARIRTQNGLFGSASVDYRRMSEIEGILGEPGKGGLSGLLNEFFGSVSKLRSDAGQRALRGGVAQSARSLTGGFNLLASRLGTLENDTFAEVKANLSNVNALASTIAELNSNIVTLEASSHEANDLRDRRERAIKQLSELMDTQAIERQNGVVDVLAGGYLLVSGSSSSTLRAARGASGETEVRIGDTTTTIDIKEGKLAALLQSEGTTIPGLTSRLDDLARTLALEVNRVHSTGMAKGGPFTSLVSENAIKDGDNDGQFTDEILGFGEFPFDVVNGELHVAVTHLATGNVERTRITIDPKSMTLGELATSLSNVTHLSATVDPTGRLRITSESGYGFDFSKRLDSAPNTAGTFGGASATLGGSNSSPFAFSTLPATFQVSVDAGPATTITLNGSDFKNPLSVTPQDLVTVLNGKFSAASLSVTAHVVGDHVSLKAGSTGSSSSLRITDGSNTPAATIGLPAGLTATGQSSTVAVAVSGKYTGSTNGHYRFVAEGDGDIGVTAGLKVGVYDADGTKVATLDVGKGYAPNDKLEIGDGVEVAFGPGTISQTAGQQLALDTLADPDTADVLVALGLNTFFTGSTALDIGVAKRIADDPDLLAAGVSLLGKNSAQGDASNLVRIEELRERSFDLLKGNTLEGFWGTVASDVGFETRKSKDLLVSQDGLRQFLENQRLAVSGVNIDEEMIDMVRFQQAFQASSRFISVMSDLSTTLINIGR